MMLAEASACQHPPLWTCAWCCGRDSSPLVSVSNGRWGIRCPKGHCKVKRALKIHKSDQTCGLKPAVSVVPENASSSTVPIETSINELTGPLERAASASADFNDQSDNLNYNNSTVELPDSLAIDQVHDESWSPLIGPFPGDLAEVEAFCRIFRIAEQVHNAVMDALRVVNDAREQFGQQSGGYALTGFQNPNNLENNDLSLLEEKVVAGLGCIGALLHQQKQEVLGGRLNLGSASIAQSDSVPPLAQFRAAMKRCCEQLESALSCFFPASEMQFALMHSKFQKLKNVCYDTGLPRAEGSPNHADIPNWGPVRLWTPRVDRSSAGVMFWKGGQVTEEGVRWLLDNGFKVIVNIRAEDSADQLTKLALNGAVSSGKLRHVRLPVEKGETPTKDQVIEFAKLVADPQNHPLYLHSQEGVGRTSMMVARWREVVLRNASCLDSPVQDFLSNKVGEGLADTSSQPEDEKILDTGDQGQVGSMKQELDDANYSEPRDQQMSSLQDTPITITPFEAQRPVLNFFSKQAMSKFLKGRQVSPTTFMSKKRIVKVVKSDAFQGEDATLSLTSITDPAGRWALDGPGIPRAGIKEKKSSGFDLEDNEENGTLHRTSNVQESAQRREICDEEVASSANVASTSATSDNGYTKGALFRVPGVETPADDSEEPIVVGDMCASTTGVVRLQSRRKAEMYLVRTDGFSCTRERVKESTLAFTHPSTQQQMLMWKTAPKTVLLLKKLGDELMQEAQQVASFLHCQEGMNVIVEPEVHDKFAQVPGFGFVQTFYNQDTSALHERVDFVVCLGGDGVILHASNLFRNAVPPVVSFNLGSLGFLTAHPFEDFMQDLRAIIHGNNRVEGVYITLRMRLRCELFRNGKSVPGKVFDVLNEVVVDRGSNPYLCKIECFERNRLITKVQADGVIVATPTGSTAYSTAAGGSMVHPNVPCMLFTPICPHTLSFRPVILPDSALLELKVPNDARSNAWVSFDGKRRQQLSRGDSVRVCMSEHPLPTVNKSDQTDDWFRSLVRCLNWNERLEQKALTASS